MTAYISAGEGHLCVRGCRAKPIVFCLLPPMPDENDYLKDVISDIELARVKCPICRERAEALKGKEGERNAPFAAVIPVAPKE